MEDIWIVEVIQYKVMVIIPMFLWAITLFLNWFKFNFTGALLLKESIIDTSSFIFFLAIAIELIQFVVWFFSWIFTPGILEQKW